MSGLPYQLTLHASKNNAFCWMSWEPQIRWRGTKDEVEAQNKRAQVMEQKRAGGVDPLHVRGLGSTNALDPARFAVRAKPEPTPWRKPLKRKQP